MLRQLKAITDVKFSLKINLPKSGVHTKGMRDGVLCV